MAAIIAIAMMAPMLLSRTISVTTYGHDDDNDQKSAIAARQQPEDILESRVGRRRMLIKASKEGARQTIKYAALNQHKQRQCLTVSIIGRFRS